MHKDLCLYRGVPGYELYLFHAELAGQDRAGHAHLGRGLDPGEIVYAHLRAGVQRDVGQGLTDGVGEAEILNDYTVGAAVRGKPGGLNRRAYLPVVDERVERHIHLAAANAAVAHGALKLLVGEIFRAAPGVEISQTHIYSIRTVLYRGYDRLRRAGGGKKLCHSLRSSVESAMLPA